MNLNLNGLELKTKIRVCTYLESKWIEILCNVSNNNAKLTWLGVAFFSPTWLMKVNARYIFFFAVASKKRSAASDDFTVQSTHYVVVL